MKYWNEHPSPKTKSRRIQAVQILSLLHRDKQHSRTKTEILGRLGFTETDLVETMESLMQSGIDNGEFVECGCCGNYHRPEFGGDCRNDDERFPQW
jgi:predicted PP-loop superfamily ATPase